MRKVTIEVEILPFVGMGVDANRYQVRINYIEGNISFIYDGEGRGLALSAAQHYAFVMHDHIKSD
jgi:hypothetical protein